MAADLPAGFADWFAARGWRPYAHQMEMLAAARAGADCLLICTEWAAFRTPDFEVMETVMNGKVIFDGRNLYETSKLAKLGWTYRSIGRPTLDAQP